MLTLIIYCFTITCLTACRKNFCSCSYRVQHYKGGMVMFQEQCTDKETFFLEFLVHYMSFQIP